MSKEFPYIHVPEKAYEFFGAPLPETRMYQKEGPEDEVGYWSDAVLAAFGDAVSPGGCCMYAPVSRAAVHKRIKEGKLSAFFFYPTVPKRNFWRKVVKERTSPYGLVPVSEVKAWKKELEERALRQNLVTDEEIEGMKPDWMGEFLEWNSKFQKKRRMKSDESLDMKKTDWDGACEDFIRENQKNQPKEDD